MCRENTELRNEYLNVLIAMQKLASHLAVETSIDEVHPVWTSKTTNLVIKTILEKLGLDDNLYHISDDPKILNKIANMMLIEDILYSGITVQDMYIVLYYTFDRDKYAELTADMPDEVVMTKFESITNKLNSIIMKFISKYTIDQSIIRSLPKKIAIKSEEEARILWNNKVVGHETLCQYGHLYSEEFTDYIIDDMIKQAKYMLDPEKAKDGQAIDTNRVKDYLLNILTLLSDRYGKDHSEYFKAKHSNVIERLTKIQISRAYSLAGYYGVSV